MSKVRNLPEAETLEQDDILYAVDESAGTNGGRKVKVSTLKTATELSPEEVKAKYEANDDTNAFTDEDKLKLDTVHNEYVVSVVSDRIIHYTEGQIHYLGIQYKTLAGDILLPPNLTHAHIYVDIDGVVKVTASETMAPNLTFPIAKVFTDLTSVLLLEDHRFFVNNNLYAGAAEDLSTIVPNAAADAGDVGSYADIAHVHPIATAAPVAQVPDQSNSEGDSTSFARANHVHNIPAAAPITTLTPATTNAKGSAATFALSDHSHAVAAGAPVAQVPDQANAEGDAATFARSNHVHNIPAAAPITTLTPATTNAKGSAATFALSDHSHAIDTSLVGDITAIQPNDAAAAGTVAKYARGDHKHAIATAAPVAQTPDQSNAEGNATSFARSNHVHNIPAAAPITTLTPATTNAKGSASTFALSDHSHAIDTSLAADIVTIQPNATAAAGTANKYARGDHRHAIATAAPGNTGTANAEGSSSSFARADHTHNTVIGNQEITATADDTEVALTDTLMDSMTVTPAAGTYLVMWSGSIVNSANGAERTWISLYSGGTQVSATERSIGAAGGAYTPSMTHAIITVNGSQAIELKWKVAGGTSTVHSRRLSLVRLG